MVLTVSVRAPIGAACLAVDIAKWTKVVADAGIKRLGGAQ